MNNSYDVIVIGSGLGGLASAVILAKEGKSVCVLEKNNQFGGNLQTFVRDKTIFDTGVHYLGGLEKGQNLYRYFDYLGIINDLNLVKMDEDAFDYISFGKEGKSYPIAQGYERFSAQLIEHFPNEKVAIEQYVQKMQEVCASFPLYNLETGSPYDLEVLSLNLKAYLDELTDNEELKAVLAGQNLLYAGNAATTPFYVHALSVNSYIESAWRCVRGGSQIAKALVKQLREHGGEVFRRTEVTRFLYENKELIGVETKDGSNYLADTFISNVDINATIKLAGETIYKKSLRNRINGLEDSVSSFSIHLAFKPNSFPYLNHNVYHFRDKKWVWNAMETNNEEWPRMYMVSMGINEANQAFADSMSVMTYMNFEKVSQWKETVNTIVDENERGKDYEAFKTAHIERMLDILEEQFPDIREHILSVHATTPLSYRDYIGGRNGNMYGFVKDAANPLKTFLSPKTKLPNLFVTGQSINMHGIMGVTIGAVNTCAEIVGRDYLIKKIQAATNE